MINLFNIINQIAHIIRMVEKYKNLNIILGATIDHFLDGQKDQKV